MTIRHLLKATDMAARMKNLNGGHGDGCNFENGDRFTQKRRVYHQLMMWGFVFCFAATSSGTIMHYVFNWPAPYPIWTLPKLFGIPGGLMMVVGTIGLVALKLKADPELSTTRVWGGEMAFILLLGAVAVRVIALCLPGQLEHLVMAEPRGVCAGAQQLAEGGHGGGEGHRFAQ